MKKILLASVLFLAAQMSFASTSSRPAHCTLDGNPMADSQLEEYAFPEHNLINVVLISRSLKNGAVFVMYKKSNGTVKLSADEYSAQKISGNRVDSQINEKDAVVNSSIVLDQDKTTIKSMSVSRQFYNFGPVPTVKEVIQCEL